MSLDHWEAFSVLWLSFLLITTFLNSKAGYNSAGEITWLSGEGLPLLLERGAPSWVLETVQVGNNLWIVCPYLENNLRLAFSVRGDGQKVQSRGGQLCHVTVSVVTYFTWPICVL